jgi:outer membrane lipoprotein carrier protein
MFNLCLKVSVNSPVARWLWAMLGMCFLVVSSAQADPESFQRLHDKLQSTRSFQADFTQNVLDGQGVMMQTTEGKIAVKRPGLLYWQVYAPLEQLLVSDGVRLWSYDPDLEQVTVQAVNANLSQMPAMLLSGEVEGLSESYEISSVQLAGKGWQFQLIPKQPDSLFSQLKLTFSGDTLVQMHILDSLGQRSSLEFHNIKINPQLDDKMFIFVPPEGVDIISQ